MVVPIPDQTLQKALDSWRWRGTLSHSRYELSEDDEALVEGMVPKWKSFGLNEPSNTIEQLFHRRQKKEYIKADSGWVKDEILKLVRTKGWFTSLTLNQVLQIRTLGLAMTDFDKGCLINHRLGRTVEGPKCPLQGTERPPAVLHFS
jgi:hypothetical protein